MALLVALIGSVGSVWLSVGMGYKPCPLCYYQRTFVMAAFGVLALGLCSGLGRDVSLSTLCLPLALAGAAIAGRHVYLEATGRMECPPGLFQVGTAPQQSAAVLGSLTLLLLIDALIDAGTRRRLGGGFLAIVGGVLLGIAFEEASVRTAAILPVPSSEYENTTPTICRPIRKAAT
jgi:hypothetical protein